MKLCIEIDDEFTEQVRCTFLNDKNKRTVKTCSFFDFVKAINTQASDKISWSDMQVLDYPEGYIKGWTGNCSSTGFTGCVVLKKEKSLRLMVMNGKPYNIPLPALIFKLWVSNGNLINGCVYALNDESQLCRYPFTNVYNDAHICWGTCKLPVISSVKETEQIPELFLKFPANKDLSNTETLAFAGAADMDKLFCSLESMEEFPDKWLKAVELNYNDFVNFI